MLIIHHRRNTIELLNQSELHFGIEVDIRSFGQKLIIHHDPFQEAIFFEDWLIHYNHKLLILNVKEEGLEKEILKLMDKYEIKNFFFLDQSFPFLIKTALSGEKRTAVRFSEYESINTVLKLTGMVSWVWVDYFNHLPLDEKNYRNLKDAGFNLCLVSPELQGYTKSKIIGVQEEIKNLKIKLDAVCTKEPNLWITN